VGTPDEVLREICRARDGLKIEEEIGERGGQKWVYKAIDAAHGPCCLKIIKDAGTTEEARLGRELLVLEETADCPYLPQLLFAPDEPVVIEDEAYPWYLEELLVGPTVSRLVGDPWEEQEVLRLIHDVGTAIKELWTRKKVVHRDIKPQNMIRTDRGYVLLDPGIARHQTRPGLTPPGQLPGTSGYRSPEQYRVPGERLDARSDIFSLGVVAFQALTGHHPFDGQDVAIAYPNDTYRGVGEILEEFEEQVSVSMRKLVATMVSPHRHQRYRTSSRLLEVVGALTKRGGQ